MKPTIVVLALLIVAAGAYYYFSQRTQTSQTEMTGPTASPTEAVERKEASPEAMTGESFTLADIAKHETAEDCWLAIEGGVYDVTPFIASGKHPGGEAILQGCGKDATELFNTRPMGSGTPHSDKARDNLINFKIGTLAQ